MAIITFQNIQCLNEGTIKIKEKAVNVKYSYNGFGKSSLAKAIYYGINNDELLETLTPYSGGVPSINNLDGFTGCKLFNEDFVDSTLFQSEDLIEESYKVFVGNNDIVEKEKDIDNLLNGLTTSLENAAINQFLLDSEDAIKNLALNKKGDDFDQRKTGYRGLAKAPSISKAASITSINDFERIINTEHLTNWLEWHKKGHNYILDNQCPFCNAALALKQNTYNNDIDILIDGIDFKNNKSARETITKKVIPYIGSKDQTIVSELLSEATLDNAKKVVLINDLNKLKNEGTKIRTLKTIRNTKNKLDNKN